MELILGDCLQELPRLPGNSVDSIVTDPPYGLDFMGKEWDNGVPGRQFWEEAIRVAKPGAYLLAFGGTRTFHRLTCAIEDAGWEIRDCVMWVYGSGFPKSHNVGKAIDKIEGNEREVIGEHDTHDIRNNALMGRKGSMTVQDTKGHSPWEGWGTALKPAWEPIIVARKPLEGTVADNVKKYGTGAMNIDGSRVEPTQDTGGWSKTGSKASENRSMSGANYERDPKPDNPMGRWPANLIHDGSEEVVGLFPQTGKSNPSPRKRGAGNVYSGQWQIGIPEKEMHSDSGSAARFFYCAKASKKDRDEGLEGFEVKTKHILSGGITSADHPETASGGGERMARNNHPTVKPTSLMRYLCKLVTPPGGIVLDPFMGSGSTGKAAKLEGFDFIGIEKEEEYLKIAEARINSAKDNPKLP